MKKIFGCFLLLLLLLLFSGTAYAAAANPFMDVPAGHWAYDAIGQLAARGVLSGYPDGAYGGGRTVTRYEMASSLARALPLLDMDSVTDEDLDVISKLGVEFQDEFYALNVNISEMHGTLDVLQENLGGWAVSGTMRMDGESWRYDPLDREAYMSIARARLFFDRWFGDYDDMFFHSALEERGGSLRWQNFYVDFTAWLGSVVTAGRFEWDWESAYNFYTGGVSDLAVASYLTDRAIEGFGFTKSFSLGMFQTFIQRRPLSDFEAVETGYDLWEAMATLRLQFTEQIGADLGLQYFLGDGGSHWISPANWIGVGEDAGSMQYKFNDQYTLYGGLRYEFTDNIGLRGIYYHQSELDYDYYDILTGPGWDYAAGGNSSAYRIVLDVKQEQLGFTSLWLGYDFMDADFFTAAGGDGSFEISVWSGADYWQYYGDMQAWRLGATQQWDDRWRSWLYLAQHTFKGAGDDGGDLDGIQTGAGVEYRLNPSVAFALNYVDSSFDDGVNSPGKNHLVRFRTQLDF